MMLKKLLANKKIVTLAVVLLLILCVGIIILVTSKSKENGNKDKDAQIEQSDEDDSSGLEVLEPNEVNPEDSSDASGSWKDLKEPDTQKNNSGSTDKKDDTNKTEEQTPNKNPNKEDKEEEKEDEDILIDDIIWGDIY